MELNKREALRFVSVSFQSFNHGNKLFGLYSYCSNKTLVSSTSILKLKITVSLCSQWLAWLSFMNLIPAFTITIVLIFYHYYPIALRSLFSVLKTKILVSDWFVSKQFGFIAIKVISFQNWQEPIASPYCLAREEKLLRSAVLLITYIFKIKLKSATVVGCNLNTCIVFDHFWFISG